MSEQQIIQKLRSLDKGKGECIVLRVGGVDDEELVSWIRLGAEEDVKVYLS